MSLYITEKRLCDKCGDQITGKFYFCEPRYQRHEFSESYTKTNNGELPTFPGWLDQSVDICLKCWKKLN